MESIDVLSAARPNTAFNFYATGIADLMVDKSLTPTALIQSCSKRPISTPPVPRQLFLPLQLRPEPEAFRAAEPVS